MARGRKRRTLGFALAGLSLMAAAAWVSSAFTVRWFHVDYDNSSLDGGINGGLLRLRAAYDPTYDGPHDAPTFETERDSPLPFRWFLATGDNWSAGDDWRWTIGRNSSVLYASFGAEYTPCADPLVEVPSRTELSVLLPAWPLPTAGAFLSGVLLWGGFRARRRCDPDVCRACGYCLATLPPASPCPECGRLPISCHAGPQSR